MSKSKSVERLNGESKLEMSKSKNKNNESQGME